MLQHIANQNCSIPLTALLRCRFQSFQQKSIPVWFQAQRADVLPFLFQNRIECSIYSEKHLLQIVVKLLLCQSNLPVLGFFRPEFLPIFGITFRIDAHQFPEGKIFALMGNSEY